MIKSTSSGSIVWKPNLVHMDLASSAAGSTSFFIFKDESNLSMQLNNT